MKHIDDIIDGWSRELLLAERHARVCALLILTCMSGTVALTWLTGTDGSTMFLVQLAAFLIEVRCAYRIHGTIKKLYSETGK